MGRGFPLLVTYFPHLPVQPILRALLLPAPCQPRHRGLLGHHWLLSGCPVPGLYRLLLQPQHQLCHPVAGVRRPGKCSRGGGEISEPRPKGRIGGEQNGTPCGELVRAKARRPETPDLLRVEPPVRGPGVEEGQGTRWGWVRSLRVYNVRLRSYPIGRRQVWKGQADVTFATREPSGAEGRLGPEEEHHGAVGPG